MVKLLIVRVTVVSINSKSHHALTLKEHILSPDVEINFSGEDLMVQMENAPQVLASVSADAFPLGRYEVALPSLSDNRGYLSAAIKDNCCPSFVQHLSSSRPLEVMV